MVDRITKSYLNKARSNSGQSNPESDKARLDKLPYIGKYCKEFCRQFCKDADPKIVFTSFKINNFFSTKDKIPYFLNSFLVSSCKTF